MLKNLVKRALRKDSDEEDDGGEKRVSVKKKKRTDESPRKGKLLESAVFKAISKAVAEKRKRSSTELCKVFEKYDEDEVGLLTESAFAKGVAKIGIKLKPDQLDALVDCFRRSSSTKKKGNADVDYYSFVDFAVAERDSDTLVSIGDKMRRAIASHNKKSTNRSEWNALVELQGLDKKERQYISTDAFRGFLESNRSIEFELSMKEVAAVADRFEFEYDDSVSGVDYEQFAKWLQPTLHFNLKQLHADVKRLFEKAQSECGLSLKTIFEEIDDNSSGHITRKELKHALHDMGLPLTDTQIKCLVDDYDVDGDGKIQYAEFTLAFAPKKASSTAKNDNDDDVDGDVGAKETKKKSNQPSLISVATQMAIEKAVRRGKRKIGTAEICATFEKYDKAEGGLLDEAAFAKAMGKLGVKLKSDALKTVADCFRQGDGKKKGKADIDYYGFVDFAMDVPDSNKLSAIGDKMKRTIDQYNKKASEPFNMLDVLRKFDKKGRMWLKSDIVREYVESNKTIEFELSSKEMNTVLERFEFEVDSKTIAVDYEQFAKWLQPSLHFNTKELHKHVKRLFQKAKAEYNLSLKEIFEEIDDDESGSITRKELNTALQSMGIPLTEAQIKCLVDTYDANDDGKIQYNEFSAAFATKDSPSSDDDDGKDDAKSKKKSKTKKSKYQALVPVVAQEIIAKVVRGKRKISTTELCAVFEKLDKEEVGKLDEASFTKALGKIGIKLKSDHLKTVMDCFRSGKFKKKTHPDIDYYGFVDFATNIPDTEKLTAVGDKLRRTIAQYDRKSSEQPYDIFDVLQSLDKKEKMRLKPDVFRDFLESNKTIVFGLSEKDVTLLTERFEFDYEDKTSGVDYEQLAKWLQPSMHFNLKDLHKHVNRLFEKAKKECKLSLKQIFEDIDDDGSGHISRLELKEALRDMGIPLTDSQVKLLVDEYDLNGDGKIQYGEFSKAFSGGADESDKEVESKVKKSKQHNKKQSMLLPLTILDAIAKAVRGKRKISGTELCAVFERYDKDESGLLDDTTFAKCVAKIGVKLKNVQLKAVSDCFRKGKSEIDYYGFVDFAVNTKDSDKLSMAGDKMRKSIDQYNKKSGEQPFNIMNELRKWDKKEHLRLKPDVFRDYLESNRSLSFDLTAKEIDLVAERFEFEYDDASIGVDYEQFAKWLQPTLHLDMEDLHVHVKGLFKRAQKQCKLSLKEIFEGVDADESGQISRKEFKEALYDMGIPLTEMQIKCLVDEYDTNGDGKIEYGEFSQAFASPKDTDDSEDKSAGDTSGAETDSFRKRIVSRWGFGKKKAKPDEESDGDDKSDTGKKKKTIAAFKRFFSPSRKSKLNKSSGSDSEVSEKSSKKKPKASTKKKDVSSESESDEPKQSKAAKKQQKTSKKKGIEESESDEAPKKSPKMNSKKKSHRGTKKKVNKKTADSSEEEEKSPKKPPKRSKSKKASSESDTSRTSRSKKSHSCDRSIDSSPVRKSNKKVKLKSKHRTRGNESTSSAEEDASSPRKAFQKGKSSRKKRLPTTDESDAPSSGMDIADMRKFKDRAKAESKKKSHKHRRDSSTESNDSDAEYLQHMKTALRTAFDFYDVDYSNTIDKDELGHILRAVGDDVTADELQDIMLQVDMDASGQIDFDEFYLMMKHRLRTKQLAFGTQTEMDISAIFDQMDTDHNGALDIAEFQHALLQQLKIPLTQEEFYALLDEVDTNNDGSIDVQEFTAFMKLVEEVSRSGHKKLDLPSAALSAMKKVTRRAPVDPEAKLLMALGVPTNFRPSVTATAVRMRKHTMEYVLSFPPPEVIYNMAQAGNLASMSNQTPQEAWAAVEKSETMQCQAIVSLKQAKGVPTPYDKRQQDVVGRKVRVCFFDVSDVAGPVAATNIRPMDGKIVGNIHEIPVSWRKNEEDVWNFSKSTTKSDDYKFIMRTNAPKDELYLFIEFIVDLRSDSASEMKRVERKHAKTETQTQSDVVEMTCCWTKVPLVKLLTATADVIRLEEPLYGGTILNPVELDEDEISRRRFGWRAITKALKPYAPPQLSIKSLQIPKLSIQEKLQIAQLPSTIVAPYSAVPILQEFMLVMMTVLSTLESPSSVHTCEPALKILPKILDDADAYDAFRDVFANEMRGPFKSPIDRYQKFCDLVLRMWPAFIVPKQRFSTDEESKDNESHDERLKQLTGMAKGKYGLRDVKETSVPFHVREVSFQRLI
ncbi:Aste57867_24619 [Aphanomyces stellatus]|uniref:Aste57867_24619 protein n=1 Tax=Aphanomyces stellatus TaxID=120398 RepID=A0A485LR20_9STRA|nr:hypothetical protein As57867_024541 [Aphanomyces stellatus]VFU01256.1 Aste57867_24619 [Aphanomyces stellatus]